MNNDSSRQYYVGLMSGTSMDGVDAALVCFNNGKPSLVSSHSKEIPNELLEKLHHLSKPSTQDINLLGQCDRACGELFAQTTNELLKKVNLTPEDVIAIGSHGQTVRHMPNESHPFTIQIGDPNTISVLTGIDTIADFRRKDIALGGQGAPLVPAFHQTVFHEPNQSRVILNIGGIANITWLGRETSDVCGFDTGPGNTLLDLWHNKHHPSESFDSQGAWAASGKVNEALLQQMRQEPYFKLAAPKSTGRELFNLAWLDKHLLNYSRLSASDIQATLCELTAASIAQDIKGIGTPNQIYICGGGVFNIHLIKRLSRLLPNTKIQSTEVAGIDPQWVEAIAFAWLAYCFNNKLTGNLPRVTGAKKAAVLGSFFPAN
ncbi:anhydro-N-acetylmuramic acid kinase [Psychrobium sp. 1_MG-2023]|uniref:anhydro-N-acetylmuramic acid kinase n=1 Tax=Psychrobium sp. 1_MG-2023 TaxID=3062624 RepID=UPI000C330682|nr:anhydro-N-acetylmuramic acid kinase [Psychrobium sp. 1_MG-2023]MDP2562024.1 anhydro-N-acetylmuramic acid kinase [Psychrobium sp. 1_MG-2023]PKF58511.1 anhydro-N-acetylmuramic acid kinase [Alteromonadales bacterium alter-6D02]